MRANAQEAGAAQQRGTVKWFNDQKGFGFVVPEGGGKDVFVHRSAVEAAGWRSLAEGDTIWFDMEENRGRWAATNLRKD